MEIREGIKYEYDPGKFATVKQSLSNPKQFYAIFEDGRSMSGDYSVSAWVKDFKSGSLKLIEYPYQIGDWVVLDKDESGDPKGTVVQIIKFNNIEQIITYNGVIKHSTTWVATIDYIRPAFKEEIPNYKQKVVKENYNYLIPLLTELNTT